MENLYSRISNRIRGTKDSTHKPLLVNSDKKFTCWRCGGENVVPSTLGGDMKEIYYCSDCKEHFINPDHR